MFFILHFVFVISSFDDWDFHLCLLCFWFLFCFKFIIAAGVLLAFFIFIGQDILELGLVLWALLMLDVWGGAGDLIHAFLIPSFVRVR